MNTCDGCGAPVSEDYARVFGDNDGTVHRCRECASFSYVSEGAAAGLDPDRVDRRPDGPNHEGSRSHRDRVAVDGGRADADGGDGGE